MRILVADDHSLFRDGLSSLLHAAGHEVIGQVGDGESAVEAAVSLQPDLVLMDIRMPDMGGLEALRKIKSEMPHVPVVMLTVSDSDDDLFEAIQSGADGYLRKDLRGDAFVEMLESLDRGEMAITRKTATHLIKGMRSESARKNGTAQGLTERELELLYLVAEGLSNRAIARTLSISENTVKYHLKKIYQKLHAQTRTEAVTRAMKMGMIEPGELG